MLGINRLNKSLDEVMVALSSRLTSGTSDIFGPNSTVLAMLKC